MRYLYVFLTALWQFFCLINSGLNALSEQGLKRNPPYMRQRWVMKLYWVAVIPAAFLGIYVAYLLFLGSVTSADGGLYWLMLVQFLVMGIEAGAIGGALVVILLFHTVAGSIYHSNRLVRACF